eukprot:217309_1
MGASVSSNTAASYSLVVSIIYFSTYVAVFCGASIFCAYSIYGTMKSPNGSIASNLKNKTTTRSRLSLCSRDFAKLWIKSLWKMKKVYISIVPHIFDQATDIGVLFQYYALWKDDDFTIIEAQYWFSMGIFVIVLHKVISCIAVFLLLRNWKDVVYQLFDILMVKAVYANYKLGIDEPSSGQRYLQVLEATFESGPQILISMAFILKTHIWDGVVLVSIVASLWTLTSRISSDDKSVLAATWKRIEFHYKSCPIINIKYIFRVICWRFFEITNKVTLYSLIWLGMGGFSLIIIILFEFSCCVCLSYMGES